MIIPVKKIVAAVIPRILEVCYPLYTFGSIILSSRLLVSDSLKYSSASAT